MTRSRLTAALLILVAALSTFGEAGLQDVRPGEGLYLIVLGQGAGEPDLAALGGRVLRSWADRRLVALPAAGVRLLQTTTKIAFIQRVWTAHAADAPAPPLTFAATATHAQVVRPAWESGVFLYDDSGNLQSIGADRFAYDSIGRLSSATVNNQTRSYAYDPYGNLLRLGAEVLCVDTATNRLRTRFSGGDASECDVRPANYGYDTVGNVTGDAKGRTYRYDALGMVTAIDVATTDTGMNDMRMIYGPDDERIMISDAPTSERYRLRDSGGRVLREWKGTGGILEWERDYIYAGSALVAGEVQVDADQNGLRHFHSDHLGSVRMVTDGSGALVARHDYLPFGAEMVPTTTEWVNTFKAPRDPRKYTAHERDYFTVANVEGDAIDYMHARYYAPDTGRFLSVDPLLDMEQATGNPQGWNRYTYAHNNPVRYDDPDGKASRETYKWRAHALGGLIDVLALRNPINGQKVLPTGLVTDPMRNAGNLMDFGNHSKDAEGGTTGERLAAAGRDAKLVGAVALDAVGAGLGGAPTRTLMLGKYPQYVSAASENGARVLSLPSAMWKAAGRIPGLQQAITRLNIDYTLARGGRILFSNDPKLATKWLKFEVEYLHSKGITFERTADGLWEAVKK